MGVFRGCTDGFDTGQLSWHLIPEIKVLYSRTKLDTELCIHHLLPNFYHYLSKSSLTVFPALSKLDHFSFRQWFSSPEVSRVFSLHHLQDQLWWCWLLERPWEFPMSSVGQGFMTTSSFSHTLCLVFLLLLCCTMFPFYHLIWNNIQRVYYKQKTSLC